MAEGVSFDLGRRIANGWLRLDRGEERRPLAGAGVGRGGAMAGVGRRCSIERLKALEREPKTPGHGETYRELT